MIEPRFPVAIAATRKAEKLYERSGFVKLEVMELVDQRVRRGYQYQVLVVSDEARSMLREGDPQRGSGKAYHSALEAGSPVSVFIVAHYCAQCCRKVVIGVETAFALRSPESCPFVWRHRTDSGDGRPGYSSQSYSYQLESLDPSTSA